MSHYGIVLPEFWSGQTGRALRDVGGKEAQLLGLYLVSSKHATMLGLYHVTFDDIEFETGLSAPEIAHAFAVMAKQKFATYDTRTEFVWVREMAKFRLGLHRVTPLKPDDNRVKAIQAFYGRMPDNPFLGPFFDRYAKELRLRGRRNSGGRVHTPIYSPLEGASKGLVSQINRSTGTGTTEDQGSDVQVQQRSGKQGTGTTGKAPALARRGAYGRKQTSPQDIRNDADLRADVPAVVCAGEGTDHGRSVHGRQRMGGADQVPAREIGFRLSRSATRVDEGDGVGGSCPREDLGTAADGTSNPPGTDATNATAQSGVAARPHGGVHGSADTDREPAGLEQLRAVVRKIRGGGA